MVGLDTDGDGDHSHIHVQNKLALFGLFLLGNMDKLNVTRGWHGLSFLNIAKRSMNFLNIGIYGLALNSNFQIGDALLMNEVIDKAYLMK